MFFRNYVYRLKCILRDKQMMFWTLMFPILLATLFNMAFSNLSSAENFKAIKIAIVENEEYKQNTNFKTFIESISSKEDSDKSIAEERPFDVTYTSREEADKLLKDKKIKGYIYLDNEIKLVLKESGLYQTIIKGILDDYKQSFATMSSIINKDPSSIQRGLHNKISERIDYLKSVTSSKAAPDTTVNYFYTLIAMACLYGSFLGLKEVTTIQANLSPQGARVNMAPTHKMKYFLISMLAAVTVQLIDIFILLSYLGLILNVSFGNQIGYIILTCIIGTITGVTFGACIASIVKGGEGIKIGVLISTSMMMSFLSGMMYDKMKYIINTSAPILGYINPANLLTDCFYSLYYYDTHTRFFMNIAMLCGFIVVFSISTYLVLRRQRYASL